MEQVLLTLAVLATLMLVAWLGAVLAVLWALRRANRVDRRVRGTAPMAWLLSPSRPARLHRRLRRSVGLAAEFGRGPGGGQAHLVDDLARQGVALDHQLVVAAACPVALRRARLARLAEAVAAIEASSVRLTDLAAAVSRPGAAPGGGPDGPDDQALLDERIDHLAAAHADLRRLEALPAI